MALVQKLSVSDGDGKGTSLVIASPLVWAEFRQAYASPSQPHKRGSRRPSHLPGHGEKLGCSYVYGLHDQPTSQLHLPHQEQR